MQRKFKNKAINKFEDKELKVETKTKVEEEKLKEFFFPLLNKTVKAKSLDEAKKLCHLK
jgi:hypothetical protein